MRASIGTDSPVSIDWSTAIDPDSSRASAGIQCSQGSLIKSPLRRVEPDPCAISRGESGRRQPILERHKRRAHPPSWKKPSVALKTSSAPTTAASMYSPVANYMTMAASGSHGTGPQNLAMKVDQRGGAGSTTAFGPNRRRRRRASADVSPSGANAVGGISCASVVI